MDDLTIAGGCTNKGSCLVMRFRGFVMALKNEMDDRDCQIAVYSLY